MTHTWLLCLIFIALATRPAVAEDGYPGASHYFRAAYQAGSVLKTNDFLRGDNLSGEPIEWFQSIRAELGWQTDGSKDWHHEYNFPSFGIGLYGAELDNEEEIGTPTSLYGFFSWPLKRTTNWKLNFELGFGFTNDWEPYDPVNNPKNTAFGLGRSVHIEPGFNAEYRFARRWSVIGGLTATHFSNGGTQRPNHGLNVVGPILFVKYDVQDPVPTPELRRDIKVKKDWDLALTTSIGKRNLDLNIEDPDIRAEYGNESYAIVNVNAVAGYRFSYKQRLAVGVDVAWDGTVNDIAKVNSLNAGQPLEDIDSIKHYEFAVVGGYEIFAHRTHLLVHFAYKLFSHDIEGRLPKFYQRLGVRQFVFRNWYAGLNVRFHEIGSADNLEWNVGYKFDL